MFGLAVALDLAISISFRWSGSFESAYGPRHCEDPGRPPARRAFRGAWQSHRRDCRLPTRLLRYARNDEPLISITAHSPRYVRRSSTAKKANRPITIRTMATAIIGVCFPSLVRPAMGVYGSPHR